MTDRHQQKPYPLRMSDELRAKLEAAAKDGLRSLHAEILSRLEASFAQPEASSQRRGLSSLAEINSMSDLANRAKTDEELAEYMRTSGLSAALSNSSSDRWADIEERARENLKQLVAQTVGDTVHDALKAFQEQERLDREKLLEQMTGASALKELAAAQRRLISSPESLKQLKKLYLGDLDHQSDESWGGKLSKQAASPRPRKTNPKT